MRHALFVMLLVALTGCESTKPAAKGDAGTPSKDAGATKPSTTASKLDRPNSLPRPPRGGLPPELRPPR